MAQPGGQQSGPRFDMQPQQSALRFDSLGLNSGSAFAPQRPKPIGTKPTKLPEQKRTASAALGTDAAPSSGTQLSKKTKTGVAIVKEVTSGDSLVLVGSAGVNEIAPEKNITLSGIMAPKFGRGRAGQDEPFAWEAREFLRKKCIGQKVTFSVNFQAEGSKREYGTVMLGNENLAHSLVKAGFARANKPDKAGKIHPEREALMALEAEAANQGLGLHNKEADTTLAIRAIHWSPDARQLFQKHKGVPLPAVVDQVRDGSTLRCEILGENLAHTMITLHLAGVQCPKIPLPLEIRQRQFERKTEGDSANGGGVGGAESKQGGVGAGAPEEQQPEPYAVEAKQFTEMRLLNRDVQVVLQGVDTFNNFFGNITLKLLEAGYGKLVPWSAAITPEAAKLAEAEKAAKAARLRVWAQWRPSDEEKTEANEFNATVVQVVSGDSVVLMDEKGSETKFPLASIRAPRMQTKREEAEPFSMEAREHLRKKLIGKKVRVVIEYVRELRPNYGKAGQAQSRSDVVQSQPCVSILVGNNRHNVALDLVRDGLAMVIRHKTDEPRSSSYELLLAAQEAAKQAKKGIHSRDQEADKAAQQAGHKYAGVLEVQDYTERFRAGGGGGGGSDESENAGRKQRMGKLSAKGFFEQIKSSDNDSKMHEAVVEHVFSGARLKVYLPDKHAMIALLLAEEAGEDEDKEETDEAAAADAVDAAEQSGGGNSSSSKEKQQHDKKEAQLSVFGDQALAYTRRYLQQSVRIRVEAIDKGGNFIGSLSAGGRDLALDLITEGLAEAFHGSRTSNELLNAEAEAQKAKKGLWAHWVPEQEQAFDGGEDGEVKDAFRNVTITEIQDAARFYVHDVDNSAVSFVEGKMAEFGDSPAAEAGEEEKLFKPAKGAICAALFSDESWHRVRIESGSLQGKYRVFFIDYGNTEMVEVKDLRPLPSQLASVEPLAIACVLAGLKAPSANSGHADDAAEYFNSIAFGHPLLAKVELRDQQGRLHVTLLDKSSPVSINRQMLQAGWCRIPERPEWRLKDYIRDELRADEDMAKRKHAGIWEHGDVSDDETEEPMMTVSAGATAAPAKKGGKKQQQGGAPKADSKPVAAATPAPVEAEQKRPAATADKTKAPAAAASGGDKEKQGSKKEKGSKSDKSGADKSGAEAGKAEGGNGKPKQESGKKADKKQKSKKADE